MLASDVQQSDSVIHTHTDRHTHTYRHTHTHTHTHTHMGFPTGTVVKNLPANAGDARDGMIPWIRK